MGRIHTGAPKSVTDAVNGIDWDLLEEQRQALVARIEDDRVAFDMDADEPHVFEGIVNLIEAMQDGHEAEKQSESST